MDVMPPSLRLQSRANLIKSYKEISTSFKAPTHLIKDGNKQTEWLPSVFHQLESTQRRSSMGINKHAKAPKKVKRPSALVKTIDRSLKRYFFITGPPTILPETLTPRWVPQSKWEKLDGRERLLLKSYILHDLPYNASMRTVVPEQEPRRDSEEPGAPAQKMNAILPNATAPPEASSSVPTLPKARNPPVLPVSVPVPKAAETWREIKKEDRKNEGWNLEEQPIWSVAKNGMYTCITCGRAFAKKFSFTRHYNRQHRKQVIEKVKARSNSTL
ncbi:hypothetical protein C0991_011877 [Blastosporella zonata]|nr:hypothetical protein C0991_011877 [Blastosporella zonata]